MEKWFAFRAYNTETLYGYGTAWEADAYVNILNQGREINVYGEYALTEDERLELGLPDCREAICLDDELAFRAGLR